MISMVMDLYGFGPSFVGTSLKPEREEKKNGVFIQNSKKTIFLFKSQKLSDCLSYTKKPTHENSR